MHKLSQILTFALVIANALFASDVAYGQEQDFDFDPSKAIEWIDFAETDEPGIVFPILLDENEIVSLLDTGSNGGLFISISQSLQAEKNYEKLGEQKWSGYGGSGKTDVVLVPKINIGGFTFINYPASVTEDGFWGDDVKAIVRMPIFLSSTVEVQWSKKRLRFLLPGELAGATETNLNYDSDLDFLFINAEVCDQSHNFVLDTGMENAGAINERMVKLDCANEIRSSQSAIGAGGKIERDIIALPAINAASTRFEGLYTSIEKMDGPLDRRGIAGSLGFGILQRSRFVIDATSGQIRFYGPVSNQITPAIPTIGIQFTFADESLRISHIMANSPASEAHLQEGDEICRINGRGIAEIDDFDIMNPAPGADLQLHLCNGEVIDLFADNYMGITVPKQSVESSITNEFVIGQMTEAYARCIDWDIPDTSLIANCNYAIEAEGMLDYYKSYALLNRGQLLHAAEKFIPAAEDFTAFMELNGPSSALLILRADSFIEMGDFVSARDDLVSALEIEPDNIEARNALNRTNTKLNKAKGNVSHIEYSIVNNDVP